MSDGPPTPVNTVPPFGTRNGICPVIRPYRVGVQTADGEWASVGTANMDNRSLYLNYEVNCLVYDSAVVAELEEAFLQDLEWSVRLDPKVYATRPFAAKLAENAARLMSPVL